MEVKCKDPGLRVSHSHEVCKYWAFPGSFRLFLCPFLVRKPEKPGHLVRFYRDHFAIAEPEPPYVRQPRGIVLKRSKWPATCHPPSRRASTHPLEPLLGFVLSPLKEI